MTTIKATADLCDELGEAARVLPPALLDFGGRVAFSGPVSTLRVREDNALVRAALEEAGAGRVLVVEGGGSLRCALLGGNLGLLAERHGWAGVVVWGAVRDVAELRGRALGVRALGTCPRRSAKAGVGERDVSVTLGETRVAPGEWLTADADGVVVSEQAPA